MELRVRVEPGAGNAQMGVKFGHKEIKHNNKHTVIILKLVKQSECCLNSDQMVVEAD